MIVVVKVEIRYYVPKNSFMKVFIPWAWRGKLDNGSRVIGNLDDVRQWVLGIFPAQNNFPNDTLGMFDIGGFFH